MSELVYVSVLPKTMALYNAQQAHTHEADEAGAEPTAPVTLEIVEDNYEKSPQDDLPIS